MFAWMRSNQFLSFESVKGAGPVTPQVGSVPVGGRPHGSPPMSWMSIVALRPVGPDVVHLAAIGSPGSRIHLCPYVLRPFAETKNHSSPDA